MTSKKVGYIKLFIVTVLLIGSVLFIYPTIRNIVGLTSPVEVTSMNDPHLFEGNYVKVTYDCVLDGYFNRYRYFYGYIFYVLRMPDKEEYIFSAVHSEKMSEWEGCNFFAHASDSIGFVPEYKHYFVGRVERFSADERRILSRKMKTATYPAYTMINTEDNTNMEYYVNGLSMETERKTFIKKFFLFLAVLAIWIRRFAKIKEMREDISNDYTSS